MEEVAMSAERVHSDGELPAARQRLSRAIWALIDPQQAWMAGKRVEAPCLYLQLFDAVPGSQGTGNHAARSMPPVWIDAVDLLTEIDTAIEIWAPQADGVPPTVGRLKVLEAKAWRPQDVRCIEQIAGNLEAWAKEITQLLHPEPRWTLPSPCPACNTTTVYRRDSGGELVRQPALQIGPTGCSCARCKAAWGPERFVWLARLLGSLPENVLE